MFSSACKALLRAGLLALVLGRAQAATLTFLQFDDLHAHLMPHKDLVARDGQTAVVERGGLARLATLVKRIRAENPNSVLMNIGDTFHGGVEALFTNGNAIADPINALGIDLGVPGNWDYAYGPGVFRLRYATGLKPLQARLLRAAAGTVQRPAFTNLAANLTYAAPSLNSGYVMPPNELRRIGGIPVGFIGLTSDIVAQMSSILAVGFHFTQGEADYTRLINDQAEQLRAQGAQLVVVMSELGLHKNGRLADVIQPGAVDVIFSAHTHEPTAIPLRGRSGTLVLESGNDGNLGRLDVEIEPGRKPDFRWRLLPVDAALPEDRPTQARVDRARAPFLVAHPNLVVPMFGGTLRLTQAIDTIVGYVTTPLDRRNALESNFNDAWAEGLRQYAHADLALTPGFRFDAVIAAPGTHYEDGAIASGAVTLEDVYRFFPVPFTLASGTVTGERLRQILEGNLQSVFSPDAFKQEGGWVDGYGGLAAQVDLSKPDGQRVRALALRDGSAIGPSRVLSIVGCQRPMDGGTVLCAHDGFNGVQDLIDPNTGRAYYVQDLFAQLLSAGDIRGAVAVGLLDTAGTPLWPAQAFVQPLAVDVTARARLTSSALSPSGALDVIVANTGSDALGKPLKLVVEHLPSGVRLANASGTVHGDPYVALPRALAPGASMRVALRFTASHGGALAYSLRLMSGGV